MLTTALVVSLYLGICNAKIGCLDPSGKPVDWFMSYKLPKIRLNSHLYVRQGLGHSYLDVTKPTWTLSDVSLNSTTGNAIANTLGQVYKIANKSDSMYIFYNDETPEVNVSLKHGHTKGDISFDKESGFWLVHSVPRFPPYLKDKSYSYPESGTLYGQTFLCITLPYSALNIIGQQLLFNYPQIYDYNLPDNFAKENPNIDNAVKKKHVDKAPWQNKVTLKSGAGQPFQSFAKFSNFEADLYDSWVAPTLQTDLLVESWQHGGTENMPSNCSAQYSVFNIKEVKVTDAEFKETKDHSKWVISTEPGNEWTCIGDINRMEQQKKRAGGTVCLNMKSVWQTFNNTVELIQPCQKPKEFKNFSKTNDIL